MNYTIKRQDGVGEARTVSTAQLMTTCEEMSEQGKHQLDIQAVPVVNSTFDKTVAADAAKARIEAQHAALNGAGVKVNAEEQLYATGTRMADVGYDTQRNRKHEHDKKRPIRDVAEELRTLVVSEKREEITLSAGDLGKGLQVNGKITFDGLSIGEQAIRGLSARIESPMLSYVLGVRDRIADTSRNFRIAKANGASGEELGVMFASMNRDRAAIAAVLVHECKRNPDVQLKLRARRGVGDVFACVSPSYVSADAPEVVGELVSGMPRDARGTFAYDAVSTAWEVHASVWTPIPVDEQAVGEAFEGYATYSSRDNGTSRFRGGGGVLLLRCLNASTYAANEVGVSRTHRGGVREDIDIMIKGALTAISTLCQAWGVNREAVLETPSGVKIGDVIPGFWRYCLTDKKSDLAGILPGRSETHIKELSNAYFDERRDKSRVVRSDLAQGWTRYIQDQPAPVRVEAELAIGDWLVRNRPIGCDLRA